MLLTNMLIFLLSLSLSLSLSAKLVPLAYGIKKLQITCVVVDDKVGTEDLEDAITAFEDLVSNKVHLLAWQDSRYS